MDLDIAGTWNCRDVGRATGAFGPGRLLRSDALHRVTSRGWADLSRAGVRAVVDLRTAEERAAAPTQPPDGVAIVVPGLEDGLHETPAFREWFEDGRIGTPLYYGPFTRGWPDRVRASLAAVADAGPGVLVHCSRGRDRTGMVVALILEQLGVPRAAISRDYLRSSARARTPRARALGARDEDAAIDAVMKRAGLTLEEALNGYLDAHRTDVPGLEALVDGPFR